MKTTNQLLGAVSAFALIAMTSAPAMAQGTSAGSTITNNVNVSFNVGGVTQNAQTASDSFTVDQRVNVTVNYIGDVNAGGTSVAPGQTNRAIAFDVTNLSNSTVDFALTTALQSGNSSNISNFRIYLDTDGDRVLSATELAAGPITYLDEVGTAASGVTVAVIVLADIGINAVNADTFDVTLTANAHAAGGAGSLGTELVESATNTSGVDTVLFDGAGATDVARDGAFSATGRYSVAGALLTIAKVSNVVSDPVNLTNNPKAIPGATIAYCITVANASGAATATDVSVTDDLPFEVTYDATFGIRVNGDATCTGGTPGGTFASGAGVGGADRVTGSLSDIAAGETRSLYFQVVIN